MVVIAADPAVRRRGSLFLPAVQSARRGRVAAVGPDADADLAVGDLVAYGTVLTAVEMGDEQWLLVRDQQVVCRLEAADG